MNMYSSNMSHALDVQLGDEMGLNVKVEEIRDSRNNLDDCIGTVGTFSSGGGCLGTFTTFTSIVSCGS